jgi:hypothetical protein
MTEIDVPTVLTILAQVVADKGEFYQYPDRPELEKPEISGVTCYYVWNGEPDCIAGHVLHRLGMDLDLLARYEGTGVDEIPINDLNGVPFSISEEALNVLYAAQGTQDARMSWGQALRDAKEKAENLENPE